MVRRELGEHCEECGILTMVIGSSTKEIERRSWKGPVDHTIKSQGYSEKWDDYLLNNKGILERIKNKKIVNVGGGHGKEAEFFLENGARHVALLDIAKGQLDSAKIRIIQKDINHLDLFCGDAENLPFKDNAFDLGIIFMALHHFPSHEKAVKEILRISHDVIFIDIMNCTITRILTKFGFFKKEWCGIEPNRIDISDIQSIFHEKKIQMNVQFYFIPPYYGKREIVSRSLFMISLIFSQFLLTHKSFGNFFGNVAIIEGSR
ncbi:MAG: class I SAM-dependent methyltransferase [Methanolinea sp.]|nr:class I SAM-dependent methyltransferase [Methanolinea sp.]